MTVEGLRGPAGARLRRACGGSPRRPLRRGPPRASGTRDGAHRLARGSAGADPAGEPARLVAEEGYELLDGRGARLPHACGGRRRATRPASGALGSSSPGNASRPAFSATGRGGSPRAGSRRHSTAPSAPARPPGRRAAPRGDESACDRDPELGRSPDRRRRLHGQGHHRDVLAGSASPEEPFPSAASRRTRPSRSRSACSSSWTPSWETWLRRGARGRAPWEADPVPASSRAAEVRLPGDR